MVSSFFADGGIEEIPNIACSNVAQEIERLLVAKGVTPSPGLHTRTIKNVMEKLTMNLGRLHSQQSRPQA